LNKSNTKLRRKDWYFANKAEADPEAQHDGLLKGIRRSRSFGL